MRGSNDLSAQAESNDTPYAHDTKFFGYCLARYAPHATNDAKCSELNDTDINPTLFQLFRNSIKFSHLETQSGSII